MAVGTARLAKAAAHARGEAPPIASSVATTSSGATKAAPNPASQYTAIVAPRAPGGAAATTPAVSAAESAITITKYTVSPASAVGHDQADVNPTSEAATIEVAITTDT